MMNGNCGKTSRSSLDLCDEREDLLNSVKCLKERISLTEQTLSSLSTPRRTSPSSYRHGTPGGPQGLTLAELRHTPRDKLHSPTKHANSTNGFHFSQYRPGTDMVDAALSHCTTAEFGSGDRSAETLKYQLRALQQHNALLERKHHDLQVKLEEAYSRLTKATSDQSFANDDIATYKKLVSQLQETIVSLESQVRLQDNTIRKGETKSTGYKEELTDGTKRLKQCSEMLKLTEERIAAQQSVIKSIRLERDKAFNQMRDLEVKLNAESDHLQAAHLELQQRDDENTSLTACNKDLSNELSSRKSELSAKVKELESTNDEVARLTHSNESLNERLREVTNRLRSSECEVIETKTLHHQNTELHQQIEQLQHQLQISEQALQMERQHKVKDIEALHGELKTKTTKMGALEEQFGLMENGLLKQQQRMGNMEAELQQVDHVKMENIELRCQLEESERKLIMCQQEISVTSKQLGKLENLATRIESRENLTSVGSQLDSVDMRSELKETKQEVFKLQTALDESDAKLRLAQLASTAKDKVQKKSDILANSADRARLLSEISRLKSKLAEGDTKCEMMQTRLKEVQTEMCAIRRKNENWLQTNKSLKQQKVARESEIKTLRCNIGELEKSAQLSSSEIEDNYATIERLQRQVTSLKKDLIAKSSEKDEHMDNLRQQCEHWQQQVTVIQKQKDSLKSRLSDLQEKYTKSQEAIIKIESQLEAKHKGMNELNVELESARSETDVVNSELSSLVQTSESRMVQLDSAFSVVREECDVLNRQLHEEKASYERHLNEKDGFIKEYQNRLKVSQSSLRDVESECTKLESVLQTNRQTENDNALKVHSLEEEQIVLSSQVHSMEQKLKRVGTSHQKEVEMLNDKLRLSLENLEQSKIYVQSLDNQVDDLRKDKASLLTEVASLESKLSHSTSTEKARLERLTELETKLKESQVALNTKEEDGIELEERLQKMERDLEHHLLLNTQFEGEFRRAQNDLKSAMGQCEELQEALSNTRENKKSVENRLKEMERSLRRAQEELNIKVAEVDELEVQVSNQERQLLTRAQQVSKLDVTINSYRNEVETQLQQAAQQFHKCKAECDEKSENLRRLNDQCTQLYSALDVKGKELGATESLAHKLQTDLRDKSKRVSDLEIRIDGLEEKSEGLLHCLTTRSEEIDTKNELIKRYEDQVDRLKFELTESKIERETVQEQYNSTKDQLQQYLDMVYHLEQRLIGCEQNQAGKSIGLEDARKELELLQTQHKKEIARLEEAQSDFMASKENVEWSYQSKLHEMESKERQLSKQLQLANDQIQHLRDELYRRLELVKNANEAVVIKEAEIARLEAKVSGIERRWAVTNTSPYCNGRNKSGVAGELGDTGSVNKHLTETSRPSHLRAPSHEDLSPIMVKDEDLLARREKAARVLFPSDEPLSNIDDSLMASSKATSLPEDLEQTEENSDTIISHDDTLAREREELFSRLDELNNELVEPATNRAVSQTVAHLIQSAARAENGQCSSKDDEEYESTSETLSTIKQGPTNSTASNEDGTAV